MKRKILVINGPNLNLLGKRETSLYGSVTLEEVNEKMVEIASNGGVDISFFQSNHEGEIVDHIQREDYDFLIINGAAFTHTSISIGDAIAAVKKPAIEVHITNIYCREEFRRKSLLSPFVMGGIFGFGVSGYYYALNRAIEYLKELGE